MGLKERLSGLKMSAAELTNYINRNGKKTGYAAVTRCIHHPTMGSKKTVDLVINALTELEGKRNG